MPKIRITAFPARWLTEQGSFSNSARIEWSTGETTQPGDIQIFAVSATLGDSQELADDPRRDAVHSIWKALTSPLEEYFEDDEWRIQAEFKLLVKLDNPVPKAELIRAGLLKQSWPQGSRGKVLKSEAEIKTLAVVLAKENPKKRRGILKALGLPHTSASEEQREITPRATHVDDPDASEAAAVEATFVEGEKRAVNASARNPRLRAAAKKRWGLKCSPFNMGKRSV